MDSLSNSTTISETNKIPKETTPSPLNKNVDSSVNSSLDSNLTSSLKNSLNSSLDSKINKFNKDMEESEKELDELFDLMAKRRKLLIPHNQ